MMNLQALAALAARSGGILYLMPVLLPVALTVAIERLLVLGRVLREGAHVSD
ncbi:MAG: hypothetical protein KGO22_15205 [Gammaproteobacteria bacterium]|nr:hypothetical protein [Gammaproteobacteria bacterium]